MDIPHECARARGPYVEVGMGERKEKKERKKEHSRFVGILS